jgi:hypothetical protein
MEASMDGITKQNGNIEAAFLEVKKVKETAERVANGDSSSDADQVRVVAGLVHQLAEQTERILACMRAPVAEDSKDAAERDATLLREEDRSPEDAPAAPLDDRSR